MISRKRKHVEIKLILLLSIILTIPTIMLVTGADYQINSYLGFEPTIDGRIDESEEDAAGKPKEILMPYDSWYMGGDQLPKEVKIGSFHTNNSNLYIYAEIKMDGIIEGNITYFLRKLGSDGYYDYKQITSFTNSSIDGYHTQYQWPYPIDTEYGGTKDSEGKCHLTENSMTFELLMPYNSDDENGYDLNVSLNDVVEIKYYIRLKYLNNSQETWNCYAWPDEDSWTIIFHAISAAPIAFIGIILGLVLIYPIINNVSKNK